MENLNAERTNSNTNKQLSSVYSYEELREYIMRINKAATYRGNCDCENVPIILREFIKGYEDKIFELENRLKECENGYKGTLHLERAKIKELTEDNERVTQLLHEELENNRKICEMLDKKATECDEWKPECNKYADAYMQVKADTVRKMQERINAHFDSDSAYLRNTNGYIRKIVDQIAKEMLEADK